MNIAFVSANKGLPWGGSEELWVAAARRAIEQGHRVCACVYDWPEPAEQVLALKASGARLVTIPLRSRFRLPALSKPHPWIDELDAFKPDVLCVSQGQEFDFAGRRWGGAMLAWMHRSGTPVVNVSQYNDDRPAPPSSRSAERTRALCQLSRANAYVAQRNLEQLERQLGEKVPNALVVRNPVNLGDISPLPWPASSGQTLQLACVARLRAEAKGQDLLLSALARPAWRDRDWTLKLWGVGPDQHLFREMAQTFGIADRVVFRGFARDLRSVWNEHHLLVLSSRGEGTPLAQVEAMLLGRPCVVTDVGDCAEWTREGIEGWVAPTPTVDAIDDALGRAWEARASWEQFGRAAALRAHALYDPDAGGSLLKLLLKHARAHSPTQASPAHTI